jgi:hypothetical protein
VHWASANPEFTQRTLRVLAARALKGVDEERRGNACINLRLIPALRELM